MVLGFCIGGPFIWNLLKRSPNRVVAGAGAAERVAPREARPLLPEQQEGLGSGLTKAGLTISMETVDKIPDQDVPHQSRLRFHHVTRRFSSQLRRLPCSSCRTMSCPASSTPWPMESRYACAKTPADVSMFSVGREQRSPLFGAATIPFLPPLGRSACLPRVSGPARPRDPALNAAGQALGLSRSPSKDGRRFARLRCRASLLSPSQSRRGWPGQARP